MARQKRKPSDGGGNEWLNTYADMVTLLLCFFILLFTMSSVDAEKWQALLRTFQNSGETNQVVVVPGDDGDEKAGNTETLGDLTFLKEEIEKTILESGFEGDVEFVGNESIVFIRFSNNLLFDGDSAVLKANTINFLNAIGTSFKSYEDDILFIRINGHTAEVSDRLNVVSDRRLSTDRANAVLMYLEDIKQIEPRKLIAMGYGKNYPLAPNVDEVGRARNRRVEILVMSIDFENNEESSLFQILSGEFDINYYNQFLNE